MVWTIDTAVVLQQTREEVARMKRLLKALHLQLGDTKQFELMAEGPRDELAKMEAEIDRYLSRPRST